MSAQEFSANPGAVNIETGTGALGEALGFDKESGVRIGGLWIGDLNYLLRGGVKQHRLSGNNLFQLSLTINTEKRGYWKGGLFGIEFLQFNGRPCNQEAGVIQGYNSLTGPPPFDRSELYQLWYRQELYNKKVIIRVGKTLPNVDFNNVLQPLQSFEKKPIPATTGLTYTPVYVIPTMLGVLPGYYNSVYGITINVLPTQYCYGSYGIYDGNLARGKQTGLRGPEFNQYRFQIAEVGCAWKIEQLPGNAAGGVWHQSGKLFAEKICENGAGGVYAFGVQRLWFRQPRIDSSGVIGFIHAGINNSHTLRLRQYVGGGLTFLGLVPCRNEDSFGLGVALAKLNRHLFNRNTELMLQGYYELYIVNGLNFLTSLTYIPHPGENRALPQTWTLTARLIGLF